MTIDNPLKGFNDLGDFIQVREGSLSSDFCRAVIEKFNNDENVEPDQTIGGNIESIQKRDCVSVTNSKEWQEEDLVFFTALQKGLESYNVPSLYNSAGKYQDHGYQIVHQNSDGYYHWHHDADWEGNWSRTITFLWYLNTLEDGYTEFFNGHKVYPEEGKLLMFPANNIFCHRSTKTETNKYICTGWIYQENLRSRVLDNV